MNRGDKTVVGRAACNEMAIDSSEFGFHHPRSGVASLESCVVIYEHGRDVDYPVGLT